MKKLLAIGAVLSLAACATVTRGTTTAFVVETEPSGAHVSFSTGQVCDATPCTFARMPRESEFSVTVTKPGYKTTTHAVTHKTAGGGGAGMAGNVLLGGVIGAALDANNGATQDLVPNPLVVKMEKEEAPPAAAAPPQASPAPSPAEQAPAPPKT